MRISDIMTREVITASPGEPLKKVVRRMLEAGVSGLPVTGEDGGIIGIITEADFLATEADRRAKKRARLLRIFTEGPEIPSEERKVGDVMTRDVVSISPEADHTEAARLMERERVKRLPVVDGDRLVGLVSRADLLKAFARPDADIIEEIKEHLMRKVLWVEPERATVDSVEGNVVLRGKMETRSDATLLVELTKRLDGVASVTDDLEWDLDNTKLEVTSPPPAYPRKDWT